MPDRPLADDTTAIGARQAVRAPEQVWLEFPIAGPTTRMLAYAADYICILVLEIGLLVLLLFSLPLLQNDLLQPLRGLLESIEPAESVSDLVFLFVAVIIVVQLVIEWGYFLFWEMIANGRSPGKWMIGLRVVRDDGFPLGLRDSIVRNLLRAVDLLPWYYAVGLIAMLVSREGKRLGDVAAGTVVIRLDRPEPALPLDEESVEASAGFRFSREQIARIGRNELALVRQTLRRLDALPAEHAAGALERAATVLAARIGHEPVPAADRRTFLRALLHAARRRS